MNSPIRTAWLLTTLLSLSYCTSNPYQQGKMLYQNFCANCHMDDGSGLAGLIPPLAGADYVKEDPTRMACIIRNGQQGPVVVNGRTYNEPMPAVPQLSDFEIANVINYINHAWNNDFGFVKLEDVQEVLNDCR